jgi:uncharacterized membrane protein
MARPFDRGRIGARVALITMVVAAAAGVPAPAAAQGGLRITTPFPALSVQPGASVSFELTVAANQAMRVGLSVEGLPDGWGATMTGGGNEVQAAYVAPGAPATIDLAIDVAEGATGRTRLSVVGSSGGETARLTLDLTVAAAAGGTVTLESDYPSLRGSSDQEFQYNLTLSNDTPQQLTFSLEATGPQGWDVSIQPSGEVRAASVTVGARASQRLEVKTTPPAATAAGTYPITVAVNAGEFSATTDVTAEVTGSVEMRLTTPDERLNTTANAGSVRDFQILVVNDGTAPLTNVNLTGSGPTQWKVEMEPTAIQSIAPGESATAVAHITPSGDAIAGDYVLSMSASSEAATESISVRVTVETAPIWGIVGLLLIAATLGGMVWVFRRYGRR